MSTSLDVWMHTTLYYCETKVPSRHRLRSSTSDDLIVPVVRLISVGSLAFPVAGARIWNTLPQHVTSASSLTAFKLHLKLHLFCFSFPGLSSLWSLWLLSGPCSVCCHLGHYKNSDWLIDWPVGRCLCRCAGTRSTVRSASNCLRTRTRAATREAGFCCLCASDVLLRPTGWELRGQLNCDWADMA